MEKNGSHESTRHEAFTQGSMNRKSGPETDTAKHRERMKKKEQANGDIRKQTATDIRRQRKTLKRETLRPITREKDKQRLTSSDTCPKGAS